MRFTVLGVRSSREIQWCVNGLEEPLLRELGHLDFLGTTPLRKAAILLRHGAMLL